MEWLKNLFNKYQIPFLTTTTIASGFTFIGNLVVALQDGKLDTTEVHQLLSSANGLETLILFGLLWALKKK